MLIDLTDLVEGEDNASRAREGSRLILVRLPGRTGGGPSAEPDCQLGPERAEQLATEHDRADTAACEHRRRSPTIGEHSLADLKSWRPHREAVSHGAGRHGPRPDA
ncbi:hypothetical protein ACIG5E_20585 [Kitasatospora sp. NPDC053057]|uniref:hypothetical protein n=1 Tax=Kitasatospora sp. NPDC053057 TaxID=3364062 RepID=UPI0037CA542D